MEININTVKINEFINFIEKVLLVDKFVYFKILPDISLNKNKLKIFSNCYLQDKSAIKIQEENLDTLFKVETNITKPIKIAFFDGSYVINALKHFNNYAMYGKIVCKEENDYLVATYINFINDDLSITIQCTDPSLGYQDLTNEQIDNIFNTDDAIVTFNINYIQIDEIKSLFKLNKEKDIFKIIIGPKHIKIKEESYEKIISNGINFDKQFELTFYKKYISLLDKESYDMIICKNDSFCKAILKSIDSNTKICIAALQDS